jgi:hypothetical protein
MLKNNILEKGQYEYIYDALALKYPNIKNVDKNKSIFQFAGSPIFVGWNAGNEIASYDFLKSCVSQDLSGFFVSNQANIFNSYRDLLYSLKTKNRDNPDYESKQLDLTNLKNKKQTILNSILYSAQ